MSTALLLADSSDSSDDGSYVANEESESDDEVEEPAAPERARSAAELIAALDGDAPDEEIRAMMREARPLRDADDQLPGDLLDAFERRTANLYDVGQGSHRTKIDCLKWTPIWNNDILFR